ncbi:MAG TPA: hypothetical protein VJ499_07615 [Flavisolibacter sp.]|nr:hypothetical protein [Flavisolibacter sp.]
MKHSANESLYFSGYPLKVAKEEAIADNNTKAIMVVVKQPISIPQAIKEITDNPSNWDLHWFSNYE